MSLGSTINYKLLFPPTDDFVTLQMFEGAMILNGRDCVEDLYSSVFANGQHRAESMGFNRNRLPDIFAGNDLRYKKKLSSIIGADLSGLGFEGLYRALTNIASKKGCQGTISKAIIGQSECIGTEDFLESCRRDSGYAKNNGLALQIFKTFRYISVPIFGKKYFIKQVTTYVDPEALLLFLTGVGMTTFSFMIRSDQQPTTYLVSVNISPAVLTDFWENNLSYNNYYRAKKLDLTEFRFPVILAVRDSFREMNAYVHEAVELYIALQRYPMTISGEALYLAGRLSIFVTERRKTDFVEVGSFELAVVNALSKLNDRERSLLQKYLIEAKEHAENVSEYITFVKLAHRYVFLHDESAFYSLVRTVKGKK